MLTFYDQLEAAAAHQAGHGGLTHVDSRVSKGEPAQRGLLHGPPVLRTGVTASPLGLHQAWNTPSLLLSVLDHLCLTPKPASNYSNGTRVLKEQHHICSIMVKNPRSLNVLQRVLTLVQVTVTSPDAVFFIVTFRESPTFFTTVPVGLRLRSRSGRDTVFSHFSCWLQASFFWDGGTDTFGLEWM